MVTHTQDGTTDRNLVPETALPPFLPTNNIFGTIMNIILEGTNQYLYRGFIPNENNIGSSSKHGHNPAFWNGGFMTNE